MDNPSFLIGIGSQRAGSTLLYKVLSSSAPGLIMHPVKELHYFDTLYGIRSQDALKKFSTAQINRLDGQFNSPTVEALTSLPKRTQCEYRTNRLFAEKAVWQIDYIDLYRPLLMHGSCFGEITPEYMLLNGDQVAAVREQLGDNTFFVLVVRNPVKRFVSSFRLRHAYMRHADSALPSNDQLLKDFKDIFRVQDGWFQTQVAFSDYCAAVNEFASAVGDNLICLSLDQLVSDTQSVLSRISCVTGISIDVERACQAVSSKANEINVPFELDIEANALCSSYFADLLNAAEDLVGHRLIL